jgi:hypothetical protein
VLDDLLEPYKLLDWLESNEGKQNPIRVHNWLNKHAQAYEAVENYVASSFNRLKTSWVIS